MPVDLEGLYGLQRQLLEEVQEAEEGVCTSINGQGNPLLVGRDRETLFGLASGLVNLRHPLRNYVGNCHLRVITALVWLFMDGQSKPVKEAITDAYERLRLWEISMNSRMMEFPRLNGGNLACMRNSVPALGTMVPTFLRDQDGDQTHAIMMLSAGRAAADNTQGSAVEHIIQTGTRITTRVTPEMIAAIGVLLGKGTIVKLNSREEGGVRHTDLVRGVDTVSNSLSTWLRGRRSFDDVCIVTESEPFPLEVVPPLEIAAGQDTEELGAWRELLDLPWNPNL